MRLFIFLLLASSFFYTVSAQDSIRTEEISKLESRLTQASGEEKVKVLNQLAERSENSQPVLARSQAQEALVLAQEIEYPEGQAEALKNIGNIYLLQSNFSQALEYFLNALKIYEAIDLPKGIAETLNNVGVVYQNQGDFEQAQGYYDRVLAIDQKTGDLKGQASTLNNIGDLFYQKDDYPKALEYYRKSYDLRADTQDQEGLSTSLKNIGIVQYAQNRFDSARVNFEASIRLDQSLNNRANEASTTSNLANTFLKLSQIDSAEYYANKSLELAESINLSSVIAEASFTLAEIYAIQGNFEQAFAFQSFYLQVQTDIFNEENDRKIVDLQIAYELEKKQIELGKQAVELEKKQIQIEESERRRQIQYVFTILALIAGAIILTFAIFLYRANIQKKAANNLLTEQNIAIQNQNREIIEQRNALQLQRDQIEEQRNRISHINSNLKSSIQYALRIQQAMLPQVEKIDHVLPQHFIFYRPRDVVSGDFYWFARIAPQPQYDERETPRGKQQIFSGFSAEKIIIAAIDCTGHGVPGAFMSMIGDSLMNQIVLDKQILEADKILESMHKGIQTALKQRETGNQDGMDMALCVIDPGLKTVEYAGAKNSLLYVQGDELKEVKASIYGIGGWRSRLGLDKNYEKHTLSYAEKPITFYLYTDGYADQFGGPKNRKFMRKNFRKLLREIQNEPMIYQEQILGQRLNEWMGEESQMDDILVIGIRLE